MQSRVLKTCSRGHTFYKTSDCPVCPQCWSGYYRKKHQHDFPEKLAAPALRALTNADISSLNDLTKFTEAEILQLHGMGPSALTLLHKAMEEKDLVFKDSEK